MEPEARARRKNRKLTASIFGTHTFNTMDRIAMNKNSKANEGFRPMQSLVTINNGITANKNSISDFIQIRWANLNYSLQDMPLLHLV